MYLLETEGHGPTKEAQERSYHLMLFKSERSLNVAVAGSIVMYDRNLPKPRST